MVVIEIEYRGGLRCEAVHGPSGAKLTTDAPVDNQGKGESFSPTDLMATALGSCVMTIMGITANKIGVILEGVKCKVQKEMIAGPRRIAKINMVFEMPAGISLENREIIEKAAENCPVGKSILSEIETPVRFVYPE